MVTCHIKEWVISFFQIVLLVLFTCAPVKFFSPLVLFLAKYAYSALLKNNQAHGLSLCSVFEAFSCLYLILSSNEISPCSVPLRKIETYANASRLRKLPQSQNQLSGNKLTDVRASGRGFGVGASEEVTLVLCESKNLKKST